MHCIDAEVTQNTFILEQSNKMEVIEQEGDLMAEHALCHIAIMASGCFLAVASQLRCTT